MKLDVMLVGAGAARNIILMLFNWNLAPQRTLRTQSQTNKILCALCALCGELNNEKQPPIFLRLSCCPLSSSLSPGAYPDLPPPALVVWGWQALFDKIGGLGNFKLDVMPVSARAV